jgi:hypothetical protein
MGRSRAARAGRRDKPQRQALRSAAKVNQRCCANLVPCQPFVREDGHTLTTRVGFASYICVRACPKVRVRRPSEGRHQLGSSAPARPSINDSVANNPLRRHSVQDRRARCPTPCRRSARFAPSGIPALLSGPGRIGQVWYPRPPEDGRALALSCVSKSQGPIGSTRSSS